MAVRLRADRGAVGPEGSVVRLFPTSENNRTTELPNSRTHLNAHGFSFDYSGW